MFLFGFVRIHSSSLGDGHAVNPACALCCRAWFLISWKEHLVRTVVSKMEDSGM